MTVVRSDAARLPFADKTFDLVIGSPPYVDARDYLEDGVNLGISRECEEWVSWMLDVTAEALRVSKGLALWVVAGVTRGRNYQPAPEGLLWEWWKRGGECHCLRPVIWHRVGIPGSGGDEWFRADTEYVLAFKRPGKLPWADNTANGHPPKWAPGGEMSHRLSDGTKRNQWGGNAKSGGSRKADGARQAPGRPSHRLETDLNGKGLVNKAAGERGHNGEIQAYLPPVLANPGNLLHTTVGGNQLGSPLAHDNEAPYPEDVPAWFVVSHCPPGGSVFDPFSGSGTTIAAALSLGRKGYGGDLRWSQCRLSRKRLGTVTPGFCFSESL